MTSKHISDQINTIRVATEKASVSSETALAFLRSAGIISEENQVVATDREKGATTKLKMPVYQHSAAGAISPKTTTPVRPSQSRSVRYSAGKKSK